MYNVGGQGTNPAMMRSVSTIWGVEITEQMVVDTAEAAKSKAGPAKRRGNQEEREALVYCHEGCMSMWVCVFWFRYGLV